MLLPWLPSHPLPLSMQPAKVKALCPAQMHARPSFPPPQPRPAEKAKLKPAAMKKAAARLKTHEQLRIISGTAAGRRLRSPQGDQVRHLRPGCCGVVKAAAAAACLHRACWYVLTTTLADCFLFGEDAATLPAGSVGHLA